MPKNLISIHDFSKEEILHIVEIAADFEKNKSQNILNDKVVACIFFEPS
ncbi:MAG TPA: aspartate carbamoyltransferase, partial [Bacteroidales bacterium]|nr:aspartate carbamoyltransferase [Bacteroidales bacterium]